MKLARTSLLLLAAVCPFSVSAEANPLEKEVVRPVAIYRGAIQLELALPAELIDAIAEGKAPEDLKDLLPIDRPEGGPRIELIRDEEAFAAFRSRIPKFEVSKTNPAPPSDDPLLRGMPIDFARQFALLITKESLDSHIVTRIERVGASLTVFAHFPNEFGAYPHGTGGYTLLVIPAVEGEVEVKLEQLDERQFEKIEADSKVVTKAVAGWADGGEGKVSPELREVAERVARTLAPDPAAWRVLIAAGELTEGMSAAKAHALIGSPSSVRGAAAVWDPSGPSHEGVRVLHAQATPDGTYGDWRVVVLKH